MKSLLDNTTAGLFGYETNFSKGFTNLAFQPIVRVHSSDRVQQGMVNHQPSALSPHTPQQQRINAIRKQEEIIQRHVVDNRLNLNLV